MGKIKFTCALVLSGIPDPLHQILTLKPHLPQVDGVSLNGVSNHRAVALLRDAKGPIVRLKAMRYLRGAGFEKLQVCICFIIILCFMDGRTFATPSLYNKKKYLYIQYKM